MESKDKQSIDQVRIAKVSPPKRGLNFEDWKKVLADNYPGLLFPAEVGLSVVAQMLVNDINNPFALIYVDVPSSGKTTTINFFDHIDGLTYSSDKFTPAAFVTSAASIATKKLGNVDLLPRLRYKTFLVRDLETIFSKKDDDLKELLGLLTRVLDGQGLMVDTGTHGQRGYSGDYLFMLLGAVTPIAPKIWNVMSTLGSRLFFLNMRGREKSDEELSSQLGNSRYKDKSRACAKATNDFLLGLWSRNQSGITWDSSNEKLMICFPRLARLLARLRGSVNIWTDGETNEYRYTIPIIEHPDRINQMLYNLARGHAVLHDRKTLDADDMKTVIEVTLDSAPPKRSQLFRLLLEQGGTATTSEVESALGCTNPTALIEMRALELLKLAHLKTSNSGSRGGQERVLTLRSDLDWFVSEEFKELWQSADTQGAE